MKTKTRVKWTANSGKVRYGTYIFDFLQDEGRSHVVGDDGQKHKIRKGHLTAVSSKDGK